MFEFSKAYKSNKNSSYFSVCLNLEWICRNHDEPLLFCKSYIS